MTNFTLLLNSLKLVAEDEVSPPSGERITKETEKSVSPSESGSDADGYSSIDDFLDTGTRVHPTSKSEKARQFKKSGGSDEAEKDFDKLVGDLGGTKPKSHPGGVRSSTLSDGTKISVRPSSTSGEPTVQIEPPKGRTIKVRYIE